MTSQSDSTDQSKINDENVPYRAIILPTTKVEFDTMQSIDLAGFRAPPTSPCTTLVPSNLLLTQFQIQNTSDLPNFTPNELELQMNEFFKQRKRGRKSGPHIATLFEPFKQSDSQQQQQQQQQLIHENQKEDDHSFSSFSDFLLSSSASTSSATIGNEPPPNSPEYSKVCSTHPSQRCEQQQSNFANLSSDLKAREEEVQDSTQSPISPSDHCISTTERANQLLQLKTQLHLTHKLEQIRQIEESNKKVE